jgi:hypothetical protein
VEQWLERGVRLSGHSPENFRHVSLAQFHFQFIKILGGILIMTEGNKKSGQPRKVFDL